MICILADLLRLDLLATILIRFDFAKVMRYTKWRDTPSYRDILAKSPRCPCKRECTVMMS